MKKAKRHVINQSPLYMVRSRAKLAALLDLDREALDQLVEHKIQYREREIVTARGKKRATQEPRGDLRSVHERVARILAKIEPPGFLFCPVKGRSYVDNAREHINAYEVRTVDVRNYFASTPRRRVFWFFHTVMKCEPDVSSILAEMLTAKGYLATGSAVSPILSFFAYYDMWHEIARLAAAKGCKVSVYMDDLTVSGRTVPDALMWRIRQAIHATGLRYHKERRFTGATAEVTGIVLRDGTVRVPNRQRLKTFKLRADLRLSSEPEVQEALRKKLNGLETQRRQVER